MFFMIQSPVSQSVSQSDRVVVILRVWEKFMNVFFDLLQHLLLSNAKSVSQIEFEKAITLLTDK
jgi:hypothetical protein